LEYSHHTTWQEVSNGRKWLSWWRQTISCETINILHKHSFEYCDVSVGCKSSGAKEERKELRGARSNHLCRI